VGRGGAIEGNESSLDTWGPSAFDFLGYFWKIALRWGVAQGLLKRDNAW